MLNKTASHLVLQSILAIINTTAYLPLFHLIDVFYTNTKGKLWSRTAVLQTETSECCCLQNKLRRNILFVIYKSCLVKKIIHTHSFVFELNEYKATWDAVSSISVINGSLCCKAAKFIRPSAMFKETAGLQWIRSKWNSCIKFNRLEIIIRISSQYFNFDVFVYFCLNFYFNHLKYYSIYSGCVMVE